MPPGHSARLYTRMAGEQAGPTAARGLEPPGFLAVHYGGRTPAAVVAAHAAFGAIPGGFYSLNRGPHPSEPPDS